MTSYDATVPANTTATLYLPTTAADAVDAEGVTYVGAEVHNGIDVQVYQLAAGTYHFEIGESVTCG
jgi:alpha-L-rhamnosidase